MADTPIIVEITPPPAISVVVGAAGATSVSIAETVAIVGGAGALTTYVHDQLVPSDAWIIPHNLGRWPSVSVVDSSGAVVFGNVEYLSASAVRVTFSAAFGGTAYLN